MSIYLLITLTVLCFAILLPETPSNRKSYIILMAVIHTFFCGFKYKYLSGDLLSYGYSYYLLGKQSWLQFLSHNGRNFLWAGLLRICSRLTGGNFQIFLVLQACLTELILAILVYRYSHCPWLSYLVWNCMSLYIYGFSAIKQSTAMAVIMVAMIAVLENKPALFYGSVMIAGFIHFPAFCFLPVYIIRNLRINEKSILIYLVLLGSVYAFRLRIAGLMSLTYYADIRDYHGNSGVGLRFLFILLIMLAGLLLRGTRDRQSQKLLHIMALAALFQLFSGFGHIFSRLADYCFQFSVLYIPLFFAKEPIRTEDLDPDGIDPFFAFSERSRSITILIMVLLLIGFYYYTGFGHAGKGFAVDDYWTYRSMWSGTK